MTQKKMHNWSNIEKGKNRIHNAVKNGSNVFFRFVDLEGCNHIYGEWLAPYYAWREMSKRDEYNTLLIQEVKF